MADQSPQQPPEKESPSPSKIITTPSKGDKTLKRKLFTSGTPEDAEKKTPKVTPKRKKTTSQPGSPTLLGTPGRSIPLSERQQLALLMQMTAEESPTPGPVKESPAAKPTGSKSKVNNQNNRGETSLHLAAIKGDIQVAENLISQGADVNAQDYAGWTALHEACNHGHSELTNLLLTSGAFVNALGSDDYTPLHDAAVNGHREVVQILLRHGANPMIYNKNGKTPLDLASSSDIHSLMLGELIDPGIAVSDTELKGPIYPESLGLNESSARQERKKETTTEAAAESITHNTLLSSTEDPYEFTQDNSNEQKITIHWASPDKTGKNSFMEITRTIPKAREQSTPLSFSSTSTSDSDLLDPQLNPIMTKALDDFKGESSTKPSSQETSPTSLPAKVPAGSSAPGPQSVPGETPTVKDDREEETPLFIVEDVKTVEAGMKPKEIILGEKPDVKDMGTERVQEKNQEHSRDTTAAPDGQRVTYAIPRVTAKETLPDNDDASQEPNLKLTITRLSQDSDLICEPSDPPKRNSPVTVIPPAVPAMAEIPVVQTVGPVKRPSVSETMAQIEEKKRQSPSSQIRLQVVSTQEQGSSSDSDSIREWRILQPPPETACVGTETEGDIINLLEKQPQVKEKTKKHKDRSQKSHKKHKHTHSHPHSTKEEAAEIPMEVSPLVPPAPPPPVPESQRMSPTPSKKPEETDGKDPLAREYYIVQQKQSSSGEIKKLLLRTSLPAQNTSSIEERGIVGKVVPEPDSTEPTAVAPLDGTGVLEKPLDGVIEGTNSSSRGSPTVTSSDQVVAEMSDSKENKDKLLTEKSEKLNEGVKGETTTADGKPQKVTRTLRSNSNLQSVSLHITEEKEKESSVSQPMTRSRRNLLDAAASANSSSNQSQDQVMDSHPRKRKIAKHRQQQQQQEEESQVPVLPLQVPLHEQANSMEQFLGVQREMRKRQRANLLPVIPNMPNRFEEYLMHRKTYLLHRDPQSKINLAVPKMSPPEDMNPILKENFDTQETKRHSLRLRHQIEREKLMLAAEQEVLRVYGRGARAMANQNIPFSACMVLSDMEVYNMPDPVSQEEKSNRQRFNGRHFHSWLHDVDEKYEKIKEDLLKRHQHEAMSLYAVQKLEWELKLQENKMWDSKNPANISRHVPMVEIDRDFDLLPKS